MLDTGLSDDRFARGLRPNFKHDRGHALFEGNFSLDKD